MKARLVPLGIVLALMLCARVDAQTFPDGNGAALAGVYEFDARVIVSTWLEIDSKRDRFRENAETAFILALRRDGVRVEITAPNYLYCYIKAADVLDSVVAYAWSVEYYDYNPDGLNALLWRSGGIVTVGRNNFTSESAVEECENAFASEWLRWNQ